MTELSEYHAEQYNLGADRAVRLFLYAFLLIIVSTLLVSACYRPPTRERYATHDNKPLIAQRYDYWNQGKR